MNDRVWLPPFAGDEPKCPKCHSIVLTTEYHPEVVNGGYCQHAYDNAEETTTTTVEHLCRECSKCGHAWCEKVADAA